MRPFSQGVQAQGDFQGFCGGEGQSGSGEGFPQVSHKKSIWTRFESAKRYVALIRNLGSAVPY